MKKLIQFLSIAFVACLATQAQATDYSEELFLEFIKSPTIIAATKELGAAFPDFRNENGIADVAALKESLQSYYKGDFAKEYEKVNGKPLADLARIFAMLDDDAIAFQHQYIFANTNPLGQKDALNRADDKSKWSELHAKYHPEFRDYLQRNNLYDIFLVDLESGDIVYSVFKELDFATSLIDGPYAETPFGKLLQALKEMTDQDSYDFSPQFHYFPSYEREAVFIGAPVYDGDTKAGALIVQLPPPE